MFLTIPIRSKNFSVWITSKWINRSVGIKKKLKFSNFIAEFKPQNSIKKQQRAPALGFVHHLSILLKGSPYSVFVKVCTQAGSHK